MKMYHFVGLGLLMGCGGYTVQRGPPDFFTSHGVAVYLHVDAGAGFTPEALSSIETDLLLGLTESGWQTPDMVLALNTVPATIVPDMFSCAAGADGGMVSCSGWSDNDGVKVADAPPGCVAAGAYGHELAHRIHAAKT